MRMDDNPYSSPAAIDGSAATSAVGEADATIWGKLTLAWDVCFLFGYVWFLGAATMYVALSLNIWLRAQGVTTGASYDALGYMSFIFWSVVALLVGVTQIIQQWKTLTSPWPDWRMARRRFLVSTLIMTPVWVVYVYLAESYRFQLPYDGNWVAISAGAFLGIVHGYLCKHGWHNPQPAFEKNPVD